MIYFSAVTRNIIGAVAFDASYDSKFEKEKMRFVCLTGHDLQNSLVFIPVEIFFIAQI